MHKGTYLIAAVLFCTAALAACGASNSASPAPSQDSMATRFSQGSMDDPASQGSMDDPALQGSMDDPASQGSMDDPATQESMDAQANMRQGTSRAASWSPMKESGIHSQRNFRIWMRSF